MSHKVTIKSSGHTFEVESYESILDGALRQGITLPYGCKDGACGSCKGRVLAGEFELSGAGSSALSEQEQKDGYTLFCSANAKSDLVIDVRTIARVGEPVIKTLPCRVEVMERIADVMVIRLKLPQSERFEFKAGQYIDILMKDGKKRSFSIANAPHEQGYLELHIRHQVGGSFSDYVFEQLKERDILRFKGPIGTFFLNEDSDKPLIFVASGTGFAPIKGIIEHMIAQKMDRPIVLYWGARTQRDLYLAHKASSWTQAFTNFQFIPVLSDSLAEDNWPGRTGFVHDAVLNDFDDLSGFEVYVCGAPVMVEAAHRTFIQSRNLSESAFYSDAFFLAKDQTPKP